MSFYLKEISSSLKVKKGLFFLIVIEIIFLILFIAILYDNDQFNKVSQQNHLGEYQNKKIYKITDDLLGEKEERYFSENEGLLSLLIFTNHMTNAKEVIFFNNVSQPIGISNLKGGDKFIHREYGEKSEPYISESNKSKYDVVSSIQMNQAAINMQKITTTAGRNFTTQDFIFQNKQESLPVLLGSAFIKYYQVGDILEIDYLAKPFKGKVIGFIKPNTSLAIGNEEEIYLDKQIILPMVNFEKVAEDETVRDFQKKQLLHAVNGNIVTELSNDSFMTYMKDVNQQTGFANYSIIGANMHATNYLSDLIGENQVYMLFVGIVASVLAALSMYFVLVSKVKMSFKKFAIYLTSGFSNKDISRFMLLEGIFLFCVAYIITILLAILLHLFDPLLFLVLFIFGIFAIWIMMFFLNRKFAAFNPAVFLKEVERLR